MRRDGHTVVLIGKYKHDQIWEHREAGSHQPGEPISSSTELGLKVNKRPSFKMKKYSQGNLFLIREK